VLNVEDWAEIRRLHRAEVMPIKVIARVMGCSRNTVRAALRSAGAPAYVRSGPGSVMDEVEPRIREMLAVWRTMPATVVAERIGWEHSIRVLRARVSELRPVSLPPDPASRTAYVAGEIAQCDFWFPDIEVPVGWWQLIAALGAVPRVLVSNGEGAVGRWRAKRQELTGDCQAFRGVLGAKVVVCRPGDPEAKGVVERFHDYLERSFLPGRTFTSPDDFNVRVSSWITGQANQRRKRSLGCAPSERIGADLAAMVTLPPVAPSLAGRHDPGSRARRRSRT